MKLTNNLNLPEPIVEAVRADDYSRGAADISITGLLEPPRITVLRSAHWDALEEDASDRIWSLVGQIGHGILERANKRDLVEKRLFASIEGWTVSGQLDHFILEEGALSDYKFTTVYKVMNNQAPQDWITQTNAYAWLLRQNNIDVQRLRIVAILRDWSKREAARRKQEYPQHQVAVLEIPLMPDDEITEILRARVLLHQKAVLDHAAGLSLPLCSSEERWEKPAVWAVMKRGRKIAVKLLPSEQEAFAYAQTLGADHFIQRRDSEQTRCQFYCGVAEHCDFWKTHPDNPAVQLASLENVA